MRIRHGSRPTATEHLSWVLMTLLAIQREVPGFALHRAVRAERDYLYAAERIEALARRRSQSAFGDSITR